MIEKKGFVLMEIVILICIISIISISISKLIVNNNRNMVFLNELSNVDEILNIEIYRAKCRLMPDEYLGYKVEYKVSLIDNALGLNNVKIEYVDVTVESSYNRLKKTATVVREVISE
ncbi:MAG: hypothetical protein ACRDA4_06345 [Filifactoraceae bacterium]